MITRQRRLRAPGRRAIGTSWSQAAVARGAVRVAADRAAIGQTAGVVAEELLAHVRAAIGSKVDYLEAPVLLGGGFYTANYRFSLSGAPASWSGPMVLRLFPMHAPVGLDGWEAGVQTFVHERGLPAPAVTVHEPELTIAGRRWFVMELLPGSPAMAGTRLHQLVGSLPRLFRDLPRQTAEVHLALHRLDPTPLVDAFGPAATPDRWLDQWARIFAVDPAHPLRSGYEWLRDNQPEPRSPPALCHGDTWGGNLLVDDRTVTGVIDWTVAAVAEPALEIGFLTATLSMAAGVPRTVQGVANVIGRQLATAYRTRYESGSDADLHAVPYYQALRCLIELHGVVAYRAAHRQRLSYDGPRPAWDSVAATAADYFKQRTGVTLAVGRR
jgi:aminoglycoside phosphotransferase (APT) family kinase protein